MEDKHLVDLRYLIDLNKTEVFIELSNCLKFTNPVDAINKVLGFLELAKKNADNYIIKKIDRETFDKLYEKVKVNADEIEEQNTYLAEANRKYYKDKGYNEPNTARVGYPHQPFSLTLNELTALHKVLEAVENIYDKTKILLPGYHRTGAFFDDLTSLKHELEARLAYAIISERYR